MYFASWNLKRFSTPGSNDNIMRRIARILVYPKLGEILRIILLLKILVGF